MAALDLQTGKRKFVGFMSHALLIIIIFILPEVVMAITMPRRHAFALNLSFYVKTAIYIAAFYINYFVIIDHTLARDMTKRRVLRFILLNLIVLAVGIGICYLISFNYYGHIGRKRTHLPPTIWQSIIHLSGFILRDSVMMILTIALALALRLSAKWKDLQEQQRELLSEQRATELDNLKSQLNPHFLFNTLNTIYALIAVDSGKAQNAVHRLSSLLRYMLYEDTGQVPLAKECDFIENYVALMRERIANREINVSINAGSHASTRVPALLFIPLIENAFKYGITATDDTPISIMIEAGDKELTCITVNGFTPEPDSGDGAARKRSSGIGLANLSRRIKLIYGPRASLSTNISDNAFTATLHIPL